MWDATITELLAIQPRTICSTNSTDTVSIRPIEGNSTRLVIGNNDLPNV